MFRFKKIPIVLFLVVSTFAIVGTLYIRNGANNSYENVGEETINPECTRTERWKNEPQYDRALSLIQQRIQESIEKNMGTSWETSFVEFPPELVNCIFIKEEDLDNASGVEGYFTINSDEITTNYFPITVDKDYKETDDIVTALLLAHEMMHVQQFLSGQPMVGKNNCLRAEAEAFVTQKMFFGTLSMEEMESVNARIRQNSLLHPQIRLISTMQELWQEYALTACGFMERDCSREVLKVQMYKVLAKDEFYSEQCRE